MYFVQSYLFQDFKKLQVLSLNTLFNFCVPYLKRPTYPWCSTTTDNDYAWLKLQSKFDQKSISKAKKNSREHDFAHLKIEGETIFQEGEEQFHENPNYNLYSINLAIKYSIFKL